jgi:hypothetical protein
MVIILYVFPRWAVACSTFNRIKIFLRVLAVSAKTVYANKNDNSKTHNRYIYIYREVFLFKKLLRRYVSVISNEKKSYPHVQVPDEKL